MAATPLTQGARTLDHSGIGDFVPSAFRPGRSLEPANSSLHFPTPVRLRTPKHSSVSSPTWTTGCGSGKSQQQRPIQVSSMKHRKRERPTKANPPFIFFLTILFPELTLSSPVMLGMRANGGVMELVRPLPPRCVNLYIDEACRNQHRVAIGDNKPIRRTIQTR